MSLAKKAFYNSVTIFSMSILAVSAGYFTRIFLAKNLSPEDFGIFYAVWIFFISLAVLRDWGLNSAIIKFLPRHYLNKKNELKKFLSTIFWTKLSLSLIITIIILSLSKFLSIHYFKEEKSFYFIIIFSIFFFLSVFEEIINSASSGFQKPNYTSILYFFSKIIFLLLTISLFYFGFGEFSAAFALVPIPLIIFVIGTYKIRKYGFRIGFSFDKEILKENLKYGFPLVFAGLGAFLIGYFDVLMLTYFANAEIVGIYSSVLATAMLMIFFGGIIANVIFPMSSEFVEKKQFKLLNLLLTKGKKYAVLLIIPPVITIILFPQTILKVLFSNNFVSGAVPFQILAAGTIFLNIASINMALLNGLGKSKETGKIYFFAALINIIGNIILIPLYGMIGAAIMTTISYLYMYIYSTIILRKKHQLKNEVYNLIKMTSSAIVFFITLISIKILFHVSGVLNSIITMITSSIIYLIYLYIIKLVTINDVKELFGKY